MSVRNEPERKHKEPRKYPKNKPNHSSIRCPGANTRSLWLRRAPKKKPVEPCKALRFLRDKTLTTAFALHSPTTVQAERAKASS
jgi:hypothetical protein